jgi:hypothetical protein
MGGLRQSSSELKPLMHGDRALLQDTAHLSFQSRLPKLLALPEAFLSLQGTDGFYKHTW